MLAMKKNSKAQMWRKTQNKSYEFERANKFLSLWADSTKKKHNKSKIICNNTNK